MQYFYMMHDGLGIHPGSKIVHSARDRTMQCENWHTGIYDMFSDGVMERIVDWLDASSSLYCVSGMCKYYSNRGSTNSGTLHLIKVQIWIDDDHVALQFKLIFG